MLGRPGSLVPSNDTDMSQAQLFEIFELLQSPISYLFNDFSPQQPRVAMNKINKHGVVCWSIMAHQVLKLLQQKPQQCDAMKTVEFISLLLTTGDF